MKFALGCAALLLAAPLAFAQNEPPVRRAIPVHEPPVARALPVEASEAQPAETPTIRRALPVPEEPETIAPTPSPAPAAAPNEAAPNESPADENAESPDQAQLNYANGLFGRKLYDLAVPEYEKFLGLYPRSLDRASVYFYMGESYRALGRTAAARSSFQNLLTNFPESELAGPSSYGLAEIFFNEKDYESARPLFHRAAAQAKASALALSARYFEARCLESLERKDEARDIYQQVVAVPNPNPYRDDSRLAIGTIFLEKGRKADALAQFEALAGETAKAALKAEATVRAGSLALDLAQSEKGKPDKAMTAKAKALLQKGRTLPEAGRWSGIAAVGLLRLEYQGGQYAQAVADYDKSITQVPEEARPEMMLLAANSQRQLGHYKDAQTLYRQIIQKYPAREEAKDAQYQHLIGLYNANDPALRSEIDQFIATNPSGEHSEQARLLKAEALYKGKDFAGAASVYTGLRVSKLSDKLRAEAAFKLGWCYVQTKEPAQVIEAFTYFLQAYPDSDETASALAQRALAYQEAKQYAPALEDLATLLRRFPKAREREAALQQKALLLGQTDNAKSMAEAFGQLLKEYPKSAAAAQAHYYIGKSSFEAKDYETGLKELKMARQLNPDQYATPATLRIMSSYFYLKQRDALAKEVTSFFAKTPDGQVPAELLQWLGLEFYNAKDYAAAAKYLTALSKSGNVASVPPAFWFYLGDAEMKLNQPNEAATALTKFLASATDPAAKAKALLTLGEAKIGAHKPDDAEKIANEIMTLQPEGRVNAQARLLAGDVEMERSKFEDAGKAFMGVALLYDDPEITPQALDKAAKAYAKAGKADEADRARTQLHQKYPDFAGG
ncbi:MAG: tetratricopeptide repeat protein [Chthoniobacterales bacterium]|nr:tetratricopeptide repeat protein [Chthoniobacterales bacterium]